MEYSQQTLFSAFQDGSLRFSYGVSIWVFLLLVVAIVVTVWFSYYKTTRPITQNWKIGLVTLRSSILILLLFCLLRPVTTTEETNPQETYLAVLIDDSQSMSIADIGLDSSQPQSRRDALTEQLLETDLLAQLAEQYQVRNFRFDSKTQRISGANNLSASGTASSLGQAMEFVDAQLNGLPVSGMVVLSDGADNSDADPLELATRLGERGIPVFTVGVGQEQIPQDLGIVDVRAAKTVLEGSIFAVDVALIHEGYDGQQASITIMDGDVEAARETITLGAAGITRRFELELLPQRQEAILYDLKVELLDGEIISENNSYSFLVDNAERPPLDVLYIEGHPRNEYKFIRRAVEEDDSLRVATYLQTGPEKYYRQGINSPTELNAGFPVDREELYQYEAIILGDIDKEFFSDDQLQMIEDFVAERGGGFLFSGMADEAFVGTAIADILPVTLVEESFLPQHLRGGIRRGDHPTGELFYPRVTRNGQFSPLLRLSSEDSENTRLWQQFPELQGVYVTGRIKPGATVLLEHPVLQYQNQALPIVATQRYGSGRSMSINTASTWRWQMMMPSEDQTHETLWRQMLRWLTASSPERITIDLDREFYNVGDEVNVTVTVLDSEYQPQNDASLWLQTSDPQDQVTDNAMEWDIEEDGVYRSSFTVEQEGVFNLLVDVASADGESSTQSSEKQAAFVVTPSLREFTNAAQDVNLLSRIAENSQGQYFDLRDAASLQEAIQYTPNAYSNEIENDLWDRPWLLALLISLMCADWIARRMKGLS